MVALSRGPAPARWTRRAPAAAHLALGPILLLVATPNRVHVPSAVPHATLIASEPAANAVLAESPARLRLVFSEPIEARLSAIVLVRRDGAEDRLTVTGDPRDVHAIVAPPLHALTAGAYRVAWRVVSADGHPVSGSFAFAIGNGVPATATLATARDAVDRDIARRVVGPVLWDAPVVAALLRGFALASLMAFAGLLALSEWALPNAGEPARRTTGLAAAVVLLLALHALAWLANVVEPGTPAPISDGALAALMGTGTGHRELLRLGCALLALWAVTLARRPGIAAGLSLVALLASGDLGHAAAIDPLIAVPAKAIHLLAGALWLGGLLWITRADSSHPRYTDGVRRISAFALIAALAVAATGIIQMVLFLPSAIAVIQSPYGALSLAKIAGLLVLVSFGAYHRYALLPRLGANGASASTPLRASVRGEIAVMVLVILLGGLLAYVPPSRT